MAQRAIRRSWRGHLYQRVVAVQSRVVRRRARPPGVLFRYQPYQSPAEEAANVLTHGTAAAVSVAAGIWLVAAAWRAGDPAMTAGCAAFAISLTTVYTMSALSHAVALPRLRQLFRTLDQAAIYLLIVGSCTPFFIRYLVPHGWGWLLPAMWGLAFAGVWNKLRGDGVNSVSPLVYVLMGWFPLISIRTLLAHMPAGCLALVFALGGFYTLGVVFLVLDGRCRFFHTVWHVMVICGSVCTYAGIALYAVPA
jgi:hemolysin III